VGPSHGVQFFTNCPSVGPFHVCSPSGTGCSSVGLPRGHKPCQHTCSGMGSSLHGSAGPARSLLQRELPMGSQPPSGIHMLWCGVHFTGCRWMSAPPWTSMYCRGTAGLTMIFIMGCRGKLSAPASQAPPPAASSMTLVSAELFLSYHLTPLSQLLPHCGFFPLLKYVITGVLPPSLIGLALASSESMLEPAGTGSVRHGGSFSQLPTEPTAIAPPHYRNLATQTCNTWKCL